MEESLLGPVVFSIFNNNMDKVTESTTVRFAHDTKLGVGNTHYAAIQRDLGRREK